VYRTALCISLVTAFQLHKFAERLRAAVGEDKFDTLFPKPLTGAKRKAAEDAKQQMSLFDV
jgi:DNA polymerase, archaea type